MCLASEAGKMDVAQSHLEDGSSNALLLQTPIKFEFTEENVKGHVCTPPLTAPALAPSHPAVSSTSIDAIPPQLGCQNARVVKNKAKRKELAKSPELEETSCPAKKKCIRAAGEGDSVVTSVQTGAKAALKDPQEKSRRKLPTGPDSVSVPKKSSKAKVKTSFKEVEVKEVKMEEVKESSSTCAQECLTKVKMKEEASAVCPELEAKSVDDQVALAEHCRLLCSPSSATLKEVDKMKEESNDGGSESKTESCGSRKSERRCKGALYKTLVSEGMLTSLRANIDRGNCQQAGARMHAHARSHAQSKCDVLLSLVTSAGKRKASEHDASWSDDSWTLSQLGHNPKKLKKSKSKDESTPG